jgi:hypothetical protein
VAQLHTLSDIEIEEFASRSGARKEDVKCFLHTVGQAGTEKGALLNLYYDARLYSWDISTIWAIEAGIQSAYAEEAAIAEFIHDIIETPLRGAPYSLWPQHR